MFKTETEIKVDEKIRVLTEEQIEKEFPARTTWEHYFLKDNDVSQLVLKQRNQKGKYHKVGGKFEIGSERFHNKHYMIYLISPRLLNNEIRIARKGRYADENKEISDLDLVKRILLYNMRLSQFASRGDKFYKTFTYCEGACKGFVEGHYIAEKYNDIGSLSGSEGINYRCVRCGGYLGADVFQRS